MSQNSTPNKPSLRDRMLGRDNPNRQLAEDAVLSGWGSVIIYLGAVAAVGLLAVFFGRAIFAETGSMGFAIAIPLLVAVVIGALVFLYQFVLRDPE